MSTTRDVNAALRRLREDNDRLREALECKERERSAQFEFARQSLMNAEFYRGLVTQIGDLFGVAARTSDDGSVQDSVLALKVPELVAAALAATPATGDPWDGPEGRTHYDTAHAVALKDAEREVVEAAKVWRRGAWDDTEKRLVDAVDALRALEGGQVFNDDGCTTPEGYEG